MNSEQFQENWITLLEKRELADCLKIIKDSTLYINSNCYPPEILVYVSFDDNDKIENVENIKEQLLETASAIGYGHFFFANEMCNTLTLTYCFKVPEKPTTTQQLSDDNF